MGKDAQFCGTMLAVLDCLKTVFQRDPGFVTYAKTEGIYSALISTSNMRTDKHF